jgi:RNA polymerase sigma-70 factor (ECF subfamily)
MVTRLALDRLRSARYARERYYGLWLPEPLVAVDPDSPASEGEDMSIGMLLMLERLSPDQRAVFVLREAMDLDYAEIAAILGKTADSCRQTMRRAREQLGRAPRFAVDPAVARELAESFARASLQRDYAGLVALMTEDVVLLGDGGGKARTAVNPIRGADRIARFLIGIQRKHGLPLRLTPVRVNGGLGFLFHLGTRFHAVMAVDFAGGCIRRLYQVANPDKLRHLAG